MLLDGLTLEVISEGHALTCLSLGFMLFDDLSLGVMLLKGISLGVMLLGDLSLEVMLLDVL